MEKITTDVLKEWRACEDGFRRFVELFPDGADLKTATTGLIADERQGWAMWLYDRCRCDERFRPQASGGIGNTGDDNAGDWNTGENNSGSYNTGKYNSGDYNSGGWNTGCHNAGDQNAGYGNSGSRNSGAYNTGEWNSGDWNSGWFNSTYNDQTSAFNKPVSRYDWLVANKPFFIYNLYPTSWLEYDSMTDEEKTAHPEAEKRGGMLVARTYEEAWRKAWDDAADADRRLVLELPNFDPDVFEEITGIDVRTELGIEIESKPTRPDTTLRRCVQYLALIFRGERF